MTTLRDKINRPKPGFAVDYSGGPVIDPTANVIALNEAANRRQDDLRELNNRYLEAKISHVEEMQQLRAGYQEKLDAAESNRLNSIRQVDVLAVNTTAAQAQAAIQALATTTSVNAENLRSALNTTATTLATQLTNLVSGINDRITSLEKSSYEGKGKQEFSDPALLRMSEDIRVLAAGRSGDQGQRQGVSIMTTILVGFLTLAIGAATAIAVVVALVKK